jgi:O-antigen/teichoic acid export membrane protein
MLSKFSSLMAGLNITVLKQFLIYSSGALFLRGISVILVPIYMRTLSPTDYGVLSLCYSFVCIAAAIISMGLRHVLTFDYFHHTHEEQKKLINEILVIYTLIGTAALAIAIAARSLFIHYIFMDYLSDTLMIVVLCNTYLTFYAELHDQLLQYTGRALRMTIINIINAFIRITVILVLLLYFKASFASMVWGQWAGLVFVCSVGLYTYLMHGYQTHARIKNSLKKTKEYISRGAPLVPKILLMWVLSGADRWVLARYSSMHDVGIYSVADAFSYLFYLLILMPWNGSYLPWMLRELTHSKHDTRLIEQKNRTIMWYTMGGVSVLMVFCFIVFQPVLRWIIPAQYHEALPYILIILFGQVFLLGANFGSCILQFRKQSYLMLGALVVPSVLNVGLNILLIPHYRLYGCTGATLISYATYFCIILWLSMRRAPAK